MGDSDDEFERKKARDKFRRERNDYERRSDDRRRDNWDDRRPMRGGQRGWRGNSQPMRSREMWSGRGNNVRDRRDMYSRPYDDRRRDRFSPGRYDNPHPAKRMRRDWDEGGYPGMYENPFQVRDGPPGSGGPGWNHRGMEVNNGPPDRGGYGERPDAGDADYPTQPPMMTFKQFLNKQDDTISQEDAIKLFADYKLVFRRQQINEFFLAHKEEEWFKSKYHPEEWEKRQQEVQGSLLARRKVFEALAEKNYLDKVTVEVDSTDVLVKILDATVILLEGGNDLDLTILDNPVEESSGERSRPNSESVASTTPVKTEKKTSEKEEDGEDGECSDNDPKEDKAEEEDTEKKAADPKDLSLEITPEQEELKRKAMEYQKQQEEAAAEAKAQKRKKKSMRKKSDYSYESDSESESDSDSDPEPAPPGLEDDTGPPGVEEPKPMQIEGITNAGDNNEEREPKAEEDNKVKEDEPEKPRPLHRTNSIFLRNLAPSITKQEVEAMCRRYPGFKRVALQDPQPERRFFRRGWVTFSKECNIKEVCWSLNNIRLRDCELGATLNRELKQRIRAANGLTVHKQVMRNDIKMAAKIIQTLDNKWKLWSDEEEEKKDDEKEPQFGFVSKNPVLKNITDFLVDEGSFEEEELIGESDEDKKDTNPEISIERDDSLCQALDKMILYMRVVHSIDYYSANEYPNEDEMPHRCGIMHARGTPPGATAKITQTDVNQWMQTFENKIKPFMEASQKISDTEATQLGKKDPDEVEKFVQANTQELARDKWLCPISGKKFKGPEFVRKHIFNKHGEKIEEVKKEVKFFNNYLQDPKRPSLPEHPSSRPKPAPPQPSQQPAPPPVGPRPDPYSTYTAPGAMGGYSQARPMYGGAAAAGFQNPFAVRDSRPPPDNFRRNNFLGSRPGRRSDPRQLVQYTDLDAPDDGDIF